MNFISHFIMQIIQNFFGSQLYFSAFEFSFEDVLNETLDSGGGELRYFIECD